MLRACARRYWFHYYRSWGGWEADADPVSREVYRLKNATSRAAWMGTVVHRAIAMALHDVRAGRVIDPEERKSSMLGWMRQDFADSRDDVARRSGRFKQHVRFMEHEGEHDPASPSWRRAWKDAADDAAACLHVFFGSRWWPILRDAAPPDWLYLEDPERREPASFELSGVTLHALPDAAVRIDGRPTLIDWKTGKAASRRPEALVAQALFLGSLGSRIEPTEVAAYEVYLRDGSERTQSITPAALETFKGTVRESVRRMKELLTDPEENVPKPEAEFAFTEDERECRWCAFRSVCPRTSAPF